jgi:predicted helicase
MTQTLERPADTATWPVRRPHQDRAIGKLTTALRVGGRAQLHWACGTGKTLVGRWLSDDLDAALTVVFMPSIALVAQTLAEWQTGSPVPFTAIVVCSDRTTGDAWAIDPGWWTQHGVTVTTDPKRVAGFLRGESEHRRVVFATYHSAPVIADAARQAHADFDLMFCDEAHRLAGASDERFQVVLHDREIPARRRVFATATPVFAKSRRPEFLSMSNVDLFGPVADRLDFADAIATGLLVDYQVLVLDVAGNAEDLDAGASVSAVIAAARNEISRVITFHSRVASARQFAGEIDGLRLPDGRTVRARAVAGADPIADRRAVLAQLAAGGRKTLSLVSNARCLTEGIDVPTGTTAPATPARPASCCGSTSGTSTWPPSRRVSSTTAASTRTSPGWSTCSASGRPRPAAPRSPGPRPTRACSSAGGPARSAAPTWRVRCPLTGLRPSRQSPAGRGRSTAPGGPPTRPRSSRSPPATTASTSTTPTSQTSASTGPASEPR